MNLCNLKLNNLYENKSNVRAGAILNQARILLYKVYGNYMPD